MPEGNRLTRRRLLGGGAVAAAGVAGAVLLGSDLTRSASVRNASSTADAPQLYSRDVWMARPPKLAATVLDSAPDHIVVHHTASENSADPSLPHALDLSRSIQTMHMDTNGWDDTGQQLTISRGGHLMEGRNRTLEAIDAGKHVVGAHTLGENEHTIGIENEGTYMTEVPPQMLWAKLVETCKWLCEVYDLDPQKAIVGHRDYNDTACPGDMLYALLPELRKQVAGGSAQRFARPMLRSSSGLPGPRHRFDHGPAVGPSDPTR